MHRSFWCLIYIVTWALLLWGEKAQSCTSYLPKLEANQTCSTWMLRCCNFTEGYSVAYNLILNVLFPFFSFFFYLWKMTLPRTMEISVSTPSCVFLGKVSFLVGQFCTFLIVFFFCDWSFAWAFFNRINKQQRQRHKYRISILNSYFTLKHERQNGGQWRVAGTKYCTNFWLHFL